MNAFARSAAVAVVFAVVARTQSFAQNPGTRHAPDVLGNDVRGRVIDSATHAPIAGAIVDVITATAATAARSTAGTDGGFHVLGIASGRYRIRVRAIGYVPRDVPPITLGTSAHSADVGTVTLSASTVELQTLEVTARQERAVDLAPDRNAYVVRDMPTTRGGTVLDVLRNVPAVDVDIDNVVSLRGNSGVIIQINGRPSPLTSAQLGKFLEQLPAGIVEKVEVISNPSARESPEGVAGIINIVLKQEVDPGLSGSVTASAGTTGRADLGGNLGYQHGPLSLYGSLSFYRDNRPRADSVYRENLYADPLTYLAESAPRRQTQYGGTLVTNGTYRFNTHDELSLNALYTRRSESETYDILYRELDADAVLTGLNDRTTAGTNGRYNFESTLGFKHAFDDHGHKLSTEFRVLRQDERGPLSIVARNLALDGSPSGRPDLESQYTLEHTNETSLRVDYTRPLSSTVRLSMGYRGVIQRFHTSLDTQVFDTTQSAYLPDSTRIGDFVYHQVINAAYTMADATIGKFQLQGGVRAEHVATEFDLTTRNLVFNNRYNSLFPSSLVAWNIDEAWQAKVSYSERIRRPDDTDILDPTLRYVDPLNITRGNPYLKPEYIHAFELGMQHTAGKTTVQVTPFFRHTTNAIRAIRSIDTAGVVTTTFANASTSNAFGTDVTVALHGARLSGFAGASAFRQVTDAANVAPGLNARTFGWTARTNTSYRVTPTLNVQALVSYQGPTTVEQGRNSGRLQVSLAGQKKLMQNRVSLTLRVIDPFKTARETFTTNDPLYYQVSIRRRAIRGLLVSVNWAFGNSGKVTEKEDEEPGRPDQAQQ